MVSIKGQLSELQRAHQYLDTAVTCYQGLISDVAIHTPCLEDQDMATVRNGLQKLSEAARDADAASLPAFNEKARNLLREYDQRVTSYVTGLQKERAATEKVLQELAASLTQADDDHDGRIRKTVDTLRTVARTPEGRAVRDMLSVAAESIEQSVDRIRKQHQIAITQFHNEIRSLRRRLGTSEVEDLMDNMLKVFSRPELREKITSTAGSPAVAIVIRVRGLRLAGVQFSPDVAMFAASALGVRLRNMLPVTAAIAKWGEEEFVSLIPSQPGMTSGSTLCRTIAENLPGAYAADHDGKTVRAYIEVTVCSIDIGAKDQPANTLEKIEASLARI